MPTPASVSVAALLVQYFSSGFLTSVVNSLSGLWIKPDVSPAVHVPKG